MFQTLAQAKEFIAQHNIKMVDFKVTDLYGRWRHITIPAQRLTEDTMRYGIGFDGSNYGYAPVEKSDMVFLPDLSSAAVDPFSAVPTLSMAGDVMVIDTPQNRPFDQYPRNVVKRAAQHLRESGIADEMIIGPEFEFYVFDSAHYEANEHRASFAVDTVEGHWNSANEAYGNGVQVPKKGGYHIDLPQDVTNDLRSRISMMMEDWGVPVKYHHHEVGGCGQLEVEVELGELCKMADGTMIAKHIVKNAARREGKTATFMPKPLSGEAGSGMHVHMLLVKDGKPLFYDETGYAHLSKTALYFIGGLLKHAASLCALTNPTTNSFKRLVPGFEAPVTIGYAMANRSAVVRIPSYAKSPMHKRFELRNPDATCNPYYAYAAILMAGLDGIQNKIDPQQNGWGPYDFNLFDLPEAEKAKIGGLPKTLDEALDALLNDHEYLTRGGVFPKRLITLWIEKKRAEAAELSRIPNPAEYVKYYDM
jgi:glutamine synthetase